MLLLIINFAPFLWGFMAASNAGLNSLLYLIMVFVLGAVWRQCYIHFITKTKSVSAAYRNSVYFIFAQIAFWVMLIKTLIFLGIANKI